MQSVTRTVYNFSVSVDGPPVAAAFQVHCIRMPSYRLFSVVVASLEQIICSLTVAFMTCFKLVTGQVTE